VRRTLKKKRRNYQELGDYEMPAELAGKVEDMIAAADKEDELARLNFRWNKEPLDVVKHAAELMGIPYQTFIKQTVFEHALQVIKDVKLSKRSK